MQECKMIFVVGVGRSGTTLLMGMLNAHPQIVFPPEFHFIRKYIVRYKIITAAALYAKLQADNSFARLNLPLEKVFAPFPKQQAVSLPLFYQHILHLYVANRTPLYIGDKDPKNIEHLPVLKAIAPDAYVFHIIRDPRDVFLSRTKADWAQQQHTFTHLLAYRSQLELGRKQGKELFGARYIEIQYEALLTQPEQLLQNICTKLNLPYVQAMLNFNESAKEIVAVEEMQWKGSVLEPLKTDNYQKWRTQLPRAIILQIESACAPIFDDHTYEYAAVQNSTLKERFFSRLWRMVMPLAATAYKAQLNIKNYRVKNRLLAHAASH